MQKTSPVLGPERAPREQSIHRVAAGVLLSWLGMYVHNRVELPDLTLLRPEMSVPTLFSIILLLLWFGRPSRWVALGLLFLGVVHFLFGGVISVIPFGFLPFYPEQSTRHYLVHLVYAVAQVPLIVVMWRRRDGQKRGIETGPPHS